MAHILVIDDNGPVRSALRSYLKAAGHTAAAVATGAEALVLLAERPADLVLLDVNMPRMTGLAVCRALKAHPRHGSIPVILMTGQPALGLEERGRAAGAVLVLAKPFDLVDLGSILRACLERHRGAVPCLNCAEE